MKKIWEKAATRFILICLLATGANLFGFVFMKWGALAAFIITGPFVFWLWKEDHPWGLKFFTALTAFFLSQALFYAVLPFMNYRLIDKESLIVLAILFIPIYWIGCYLGSSFLRRPTNMNPS